MFSQQVRLIGPLLCADDHRFWPDEMHDICILETRSAHPARTILACIIEASLCFYEHVQTHQQTRSIFPSAVIYEAIINN